MTSPLAMGLTQNWRLSITFRRLSGCWSLVPWDFNLTTWTLSWLKHKKASWYHLATSSGTDLLKLIYPPLSPPNMITNTQACGASIQTFSKGINQIAEDTLALIKFVTITTNNLMVIIRAKSSTKQPPRKLFSGGSICHSVRVNFPPSSGYEQRISYDT